MLLQSQTDTATLAPTKNRKKRRGTISSLKELAGDRVVKCMLLCTLCDSSGTARIRDYQSPSQGKSIGGVGSQSVWELACEGSLTLQSTMPDKEYEVDELDTDTYGESKVKLAYIVLIKKALFSCNLTSMRCRPILTSRKGCVGVEAWLGKFRPRDT